MTTFTCTICKQDYPVADDCGGDCVYCMAEAGDPDCIRNVDEHPEEFREAMKGVQRIVISPEAAADMERLGVSSDEIISMLMGKMGKLS